MRVTFNRLLTFLLFLWCNNVIAQNFSHPIWPDTSEPKTLINPESDLSVFGGVAANYASINEAAWVFIGAQAGIVVDKHFLFGIAGYGLVSNVESIGINNGVVVNGNPLRVYGGYGGLITGIRLAPTKIVHVNFPVFIGAGNFELVDRNYFAGTNTDFTIERSGSFVFEPSGEIEINVTAKFRIALGTGYRLVKGLNLVNLSDRDVTTICSHFALKFGRY